MLFYVKNALQQTGLDPARLELEITESAVLGDMDLVVERLEQLRSLGVELAIDDFGTGYCSLSYLKNLPVDRMKVDRAFVANIEVDKKSQAILQSIVSLGQAMSLKVLAEGVEIEEQANILRSIGCHEVQGFLYAKPVDALDFETWFRRRESSRLGKMIERRS